MQLLTDQGWQMYYSCMCGGSLKQYWTNENFSGYEIRTRPTKNTFSILSRNQIVFGPDWVYKMEDKLKEYGIYNER